MQKLCVFFLLFMTTVWGSDAESDITEHHRRVAARFLKMIENDLSSVDDPLMLDVSGEVAAVVKQLTLEENPAFAVFYDEEAWDKILHFTPDLLRTEEGKATAKMLGVEHLKRYEEFRAGVAQAIDSDKSNPRICLFRAWFFCDLNDPQLVRGIVMPRDVHSRLYSIMCAYNHPDRADDFFTRLGGE